MNRFRILCEVSGGVTGYRCSYLKRRGKVQVYDDQLTAELDASALNEKMNADGNVAIFKYTAERCMSGAELLATHRYTGQGGLDLD